MPVVDQNHQTTLQASLQHCCQVNVSLVESLPWGWDSASLEVVIGVFTRWRNPLTLLSDNWEITYSATSVNKLLSFGINSLVTCLIVLVNRVFIPVRMVE